LTLATGLPVPAVDVASSATVYFTPYIGSRIALYANSYGWRNYAFSELSLDISGVATDKNIDIWIYDNAGTLTLDYTEWSHNTLRATALARQDGVLVKSGAPAYRYLGTVRTSNNGVSADTVLKRYCWNYYNRVEVNLTVKDSSDSWTYNVGTTWRSLDNSANNRVNFVIGVDEVLVKFLARLFAENSGASYCAVGIGLDVTNANHAHFLGASKGSTPQWNTAEYRGFPGIGYHFLQLLEYVTGGTGTFYGDNGLPAVIASGGFGSLWC
jgi:hypothetical protein